METRNCKLLHSSTMDDDRLSSLPEELLCRILSFLPTKQAVATSVLSKKWKPLWRSLPTVDIDDCNVSKRDHARFVESVSAFINNHHQALQKFRLRFSQPRREDHPNVTACVESALKILLQHLQIEHIDIALPFPFVRRPEPGGGLQPPKLTISPLIFSFTNLVVLKLEGFTFNPISSVDFPFLKTLHLQAVLFSKPECLAQLLSGCPVLEGFKGVCIVCEMGCSGEIQLPKLVRANVSGKYAFLLKAVKNVQFLHINQIDDSNLHNFKSTNQSVFPMFHNLTHMELSFYFTMRKDWFQALGLLKYCPQLQVLVINQPNKYGTIEGEVRDWQCPESVPECILLHLKRCYLNYYRGTRGEFQFARYIMRNGRVLEKMRISCGYGLSQQEKHKNLKELSLCTRKSETCELSFE